MELWGSLAGSVEARFYSAADWQRARLELFYFQRTTTPALRVPDFFMSSVSQAT
ncbi:MAG: hypothetical protein ACRC20_17150 [Segniliparus sp.]|uniref:hypothetical protein n=1 Tax=Segniliparus sp. TaxID=2804064 RepID=UPI003F3F3BEA